MSCSHFCISSIKPSIWYLADTRETFVSEWMNNWTTVKARFQILFLSLTGPSHDSKIPPCRYTDVQGRIKGINRGHLGHRLYLPCNFIGIDGLTNLEICFQKAFGLFPSDQSRWVQVLELWQRTAMASYSVQGASADDTEGLSRVRLDPETGRSPHRGYTGGGWRANETEGRSVISTAPSGPQSWCQNQREHQGLPFLLLGVTCFWPCIWGPKSSMTLQANSPSPELIWFHSPTLHQKQGPYFRLNWPQDTCPRMLWKCATHTHTNHFSIQKVLGGLPWWSSC